MAGCGSDRLQQGDEVIVFDPKEETVLVDGLPDPTLLGIKARRVAVGSKATVISDDDPLDSEFRDVRISVKEGAYLGPATIRRVHLRPAK